MVQTTKPILTDTIKTQNTQLLSQNTKYLHLDIESGTGRMGMVEPNRIEDQK